MSVTITQETITPSEANRLLSRNTHNRNIRKRLVETISRDIAAGQWKLNGETIKFGEDGKLLDGQHRLLAIVEAGKPIETVVVRGLPDEVQDSVDTGARRQYKDVLKLHGEPHTAVLAAATRASWYLTHYGRTRQFGVAPSQVELKSHLIKNPGLRDFTVLGIQGGRSVLHITPSVTASLAYHMHKLSPAKADEFWRLLLENEAPKGSAIYGLRESLLRDLGRPHRMDVMHRAAFIIKAWNYWITGRSADFIAWRGSGAGAEAFPKINAPEEVAA